MPRRLGVWIVEADMHGGASMPVTVVLIKPVAAAERLWVFVGEWVCVEACRWGSKWDSACAAQTGNRLSVAAGFRGNRVVVFS